MANRKLKTVEINSHKTEPRSLEAAIAIISRLEKEILETISVTQTKVYQLECLTQFSAILNSTLDTQSVREKALEATCKLLNCATGSLLLVDAATNELYWETALGASGEELKQAFRLAINDQSIAGHVALTCKSIVVNDVAQSPFHFKKADEKTKFKTLNMVCVPVVAKGTVIGVLEAINKRDGDFTQEDLGLLETLSHQVAIAVENAQLYTKLKETFVQTAAAMAGAIEAKDRYTGGHTKRVLHYSLAIAEYVNLTSTQRENLRLAAILHDIGKIGIDDKILKKQYALNDEEYQTMKSHPAIGYEILSQVNELKDVIDGARYHHERPDGKGYPYGLKGDEIPKIASIISVADTYDAMVSTRPYRKGLDPKIAFSEITKYRGTQFDAEVVDAFVKAFESGSLRKRVKET
ncbi:MAG: HD domain-containing phosphohydrolase [Bdellovibrionota bacterium]